MQIILCIEKSLTFLLLFCISYVFTFSSIVIVVVGIPAAVAVDLFDLRSFY